jgi:hypothetical protein
MLKTKNIMGLAHPVPAGFAETAFAAGDYLIRSNPVANGITFYVFSHFYNVTKEFVARDEGRLDISRLYTITPEHSRAVPAFQITGADTAAFYLDDNIIIAAFGSRIGRFITVIGRAIGNKRLHGFGIVTHIKLLK